MISIGNVVLSDHLLLPGIKNISTRATSTRYTMSPGGSRAVVQSFAMPTGQSITLVDDGNYGLFTGAQVDAINAYKASGAIVPLIHHQGSWQVIVTEVAVEQADGLADPMDTDTYFGTITMQITG